jgi:UDP-N-acetylmuramyl tripeptide synthase
MKKIRLTAAILSVRLLKPLMRLTGSGGTSLPGKVALKICPDLLEQLSRKFRIIMVTGTNGKTTTSRMIAKMLEENGIRFMTNKSGANLASGITATVATAVTALGKPETDWLLIEADEAAFRITAPRLRPESVIVTNFFRDQLDRYGELYSTLNSVREGLLGSPGTQLIVNADDSLCASLSIDLATGNPVANPVFSFGFSKEASTGQEPQISDAAYCIRCSTKYTYAASTYGHLGHFSCSHCGYTRPIVAVHCSKVITSDDQGSQVIIQNPREAFDAQVHLPGLYNVYNALAAATLGYVMSIPAQQISTALAEFECGFGRMETIKIGDRQLQVILVKNPTGFNQVLQYLTTVEAGSIPLFMINDRLADGTDISWLWDVDFEQLSNQQTRFPLFFSSGIRAEDMAVRLKYAGISEDRIKVEHNLETLLDLAIQSLEKSGTLYIMPTYTAMLELRKILKRRYKLKNFWE